MRAVFGILALESVRNRTVIVGENGLLLHPDKVGDFSLTMRVRLDEEALKTIADVTHGEYFYASTATDLKKIYQALTARLVLETNETEITALFSAASAVLAFLAALFSLLWFNRIL